MTAKTKTDQPKPEFAKITPNMSHEQIVRNLVAVLEKSGISVKQDTDVSEDTKRGEE